MPTVNAMVMRNDVIIRETRLFGAILKQKLSLFLFLYKMSIQTSALIEAKCLRTTCTRLAIKILRCLNKLHLRMTSEACRARYWRSSFTFLQNSGIYKLSWHSKDPMKGPTPPFNPPSHTTPLPSLYASLTVMFWLTQCTSEGSMKVTQSRIRLL